MDRFQMIYYPREAIEQKYSEGRLSQVELNLFQYIRKHKQDIIKENLEKEDVDSSESFYSAVEAVIYKRGSVHLPSEMAEQIKEISKEIWYRGEELDGEINTQTVSEEWTVKYSSMWREARRLELNYLVEINKDKIKEIYSENE